MGLKVDKAKSEQILELAVSRAVSGGPLPEEWIRWTKRVDASPSLTFTAALGTALLAKATNPLVDALSLKASAGPSAYSARNIGHGVLVPGAVRYGFDLRATGREPLNNQPFFQNDRIDTIERIHVNARPFLPDLIAACRAINELDSEEAQLALAAFIRVRMAAAHARQAMEVSQSSFPIGDLIESTSEFISSNPEHGRRGQAFVAAAFDLASPTVRSARVNDPSRNFPGDVQVLENDVVVLAVEVRQKTVSFEEALQFAESLKKGKVLKGLVAMLSPDQKRLDAGNLLTEAESRHGVVLGASYGVQDVLLDVSIWGGISLAEIGAMFPERMLRRLEEIETSENGIRDWVSRFEISS